MIKMKCVYDKKEPEDGKWILVDREWPEDIQKEKIDKWNKELGPSVGLLSAWNKKEIDWIEYEKRYEKEIIKQKGLINTVIEKGKKENITLVYSQKEDVPCHRKLLVTVFNINPFITQRISKEMIEHNSKYGGIYWDLGILLGIFSKRYKDALKSFDKAIKLMPDYFEGWVNRGVVLKELKKYKKAIKSFNKAIELKPDYAQAWYNRGIIFDILRKHKEALKDFDKAIELKPDYAQAWGSRGIIYFLMGDYEIAKENLRKTIKIASVQKDVQIEDISNAIYYLAFGMDKLSKYMSRETPCERVKMLKEAEKDLKKSFGYFKKTKREKKEEICKIMNIISANVKFEQYLYQDLCSFKKGVEKITNDFAKLEIKEVDFIILNFKEDLLYFSIVKKALDLEKIEINSLNKVKRFLIHSKTEEERERIAKFKQFIALLNDYRKWGYTDIRHIPKIERDNLMKLIRPSAIYVNRNSTQETSKETIEQMQVLLSKYMCQATRYFREQKSFQQQFVKDHEVLQEPISQMLKYSTADYKITIKPGPKRAGILIINDKQIRISSIESDLCRSMADQLQNDWKYIGERDEVDVGWVSFDAFRKTVGRWIKYEEKKKQEISDEIIITAIYRLNTKIRKALRFKKKDKDLIENGDYYGWEKCYRFRVYPPLISLK